MSLFCPWETVTCNSCGKDITSATRVACMECDNFDLCLECFSQGKEIGPHLNDHKYRVIPSLHFPLLTNDWGADEEFMLLRGIEEKGMDNWGDISKYVKTKGPRECRSHYYECYLNSEQTPLPNIEESYLKKHGIVDMKPSKIFHHRDDEFEAKPQKDNQSTQPNYEGYDAQFNPYRREFGFEYFNNAELSVCDIVFDDKDTPEEREQKFVKLEHYYKMYNERVRIREIVMKEELLDSKKIKNVDRKRSKEERELWENHTHFIGCLGKNELEKYIKAVAEENKIHSRILSLKQKREEGCLTLLETKTRRSKAVNHKLPKKYPK